MIKLNNVEKDVKRFIKRKVSVTMATMVVFLMTGAFSTANTTLEGRITSVEGRMTSVENKKLDTETFTQFTDKLKNAMGATMATIENLGQGMNKLITDKLDVSEFTEDKVTEKVKKGSLTSSSLNVGGSGKVVEADITVELKDETKAEIAKIADVNEELAKKADKTALETETTERKADDLKLLKTIGALADANNEEVQTIKQAITDEKTAREAADENIKQVHDNLARIVDEFNTAQVKFNDTVDQSLNIIDNSLIEIETLKTDVDELKILNGTQDGLAKIEELKTTVDTKANSADVYTKKESDERFVKIEGAVENQGNIATTHAKRIDILEVKTEKLERRIDSVASITAAMTTLDLGNVPVGQLGMGISFGASGKSRAVAAGLGFSPTENFKLNAKFSTSTGKERRTAVGAGAVYYLNLK